jgi:hypothetical protein
MMYPTFFLRSTFRDIRCLPTTLRKFLEVIFQFGFFFNYYYNKFMILLWSLVLSVNEVGKLHKPCEFSHLILRVHCLSVELFELHKYLFDMVVWRNDSDCTEMIQCNHLPSPREFGEVLTSLWMGRLNRPTNLHTQGD